MSIGSSSWVSFETQICCTEVGLYCRHPWAQCRNWCNSRFYRCWSAFWIPTHPERLGSLWGCQLQEGLSTILWIHPHWSIGLPVWWISVSSCEYWSLCQAGLKIIIDLPSALFSQTSPFACGLFMVAVVISVQQLQCDKDHFTSRLVASNEFQKWFPFPQLFRRWEQVMFR
jgi:hypothetical protein